MNNSKKDLNRWEKEGLGSLALARRIEERRLVLTRIGGTYLRWKLQRESLSLFVLWLAPPVVSLNPSGQRGT